MLPVLQGPAPIPVLCRTGPVAEFRYRRLSVADTTAAHSATISCESASEVRIPKLGETTLPPRMASSFRLVLAAVRPISLHPFGYLPTLLNRHRLPATTFRHRADAIAATPATGLLQFLQLGNNTINPFFFEYQLSNRFVQIHADLRRRPRLAAMFPAVVKQIPTPFHCISMHQLDGVGATS